MAIEKVVDVSPDLVQKAAAQIGRNDDQSREVATREVFTHSVETWLPVVVAVLKTAGVVHSATGKRRPRRFDEAVWDQLDKAEKTVGVSRVALLRTCLELQGEQGDDVEQFVQRFSATVQSSEQEIRAAMEETAC